MNMISAIKYLLLFTSFLPLYDINAQDYDNKLLESVRDRFRTINNLTVDVIQKSGGKEILSGNLIYKKTEDSEKIHLDLKNNLIISDGFSMWNYNKSEKKVIINSVSETDPSFFSFKKIAYDYPDQCNISSEKSGSENILILTPKENNNLGFSRAKLWIRNDSLISKVILEGGGGKAEIEFLNYKLNQNISDSKFRFTPPEGSKIIDLR